MTQKTVNCPHCKTPVIWNKDNPFRPFCSEQCKNIDFIGWANEEKSIPGSTEYDELMSENIKFNH